MLFTLLALCGGADTRVVAMDTFSLPTQNFMVMPDALGLTYINDLSPPDMDKVRSVTLVELTITFDDHNLPLRPRRATKLKNVPGKGGGGGVPEIAEWGEYCLQCSMLVSFQFFGSQYYIRQLMCRQQYVHYSKLNNCLLMRCTRYPPTHPV